MILRLRCALVPILLCLVLGPVPSALGQVSTANVTGAVEDSTGARIEDAVVKLINTETGTENDSRTSGYGEFLLPGVIPGSYILEIERSGFATVQVAGLTLSVGETRNLLVRMQVGSILQTVKVDASGLALDTTDGAVSTVINPQFVTSLPLAGRSFRDLITITPGVVTQTPEANGSPVGPQGDFSVNGQRPDTNTFTVDGVSANFGIRSLTGHQKVISTGALAGTTAIGTTQTMISADALQEFRALASSYSTEYGGTPGGQFVLSSLSGTNMVHGSAFEYIGKNYFNASNWFEHYYQLTPEGAGRYHQTDFGGTFAAPLSFLRIPCSGRTFLFASFEGFRDYEPAAPVIQFWPTNELASEVPSPLFPLVYSFGYISGGYTTSSVGNSVLDELAVAPWVYPDSVSATSIRLDHVFSPKLSGFLRLSDAPSNSTSAPPAEETINRLRAQTITLGTTAQLSSTLTNDFRLGYARSYASLNTTSDAGYTPASGRLNSAVGIPSADTSAVADAFIFSAGAGTAELKNDDVSGALHQWDIRDTLTAQAAHHLLQAGIEERHIASNLNPPPISVEADFFDKSSLLNNQASDISISRSLPAAIDINEFAGFVQDQWHATKSLTLSPGLRWEVDPPPSGENGEDAYTLRGNLANPSSLTLAPRGTPLWKTAWFNFAPRIGAAWIANRHPSRELVVRAGGGVFFNNGNRAASPAFSALGFSATSQTRDAPIPVTAAQLNFSPVPAAPYTNTVAFAFPQHLQLPYALQWNLSVEKALGRNQTLITSWVASAGRRLLEERRTDIRTRNPELGEIVTYPGGLTSNYEALQVKFQRSVSPGLQILAAYTWSHALDYGSVDPAWPLEYGNSDFDVRHDLQAGMVWKERDHFGDWFRKYVEGGWELDGRVTARSAFPVTPLGMVYSDPATGNRYYSGANLIPARPLYLYGRQYPGGRMFNGGPNATDPAFVLPMSGAPGDEPRNILRGFGDEQIDLALRRDVRLRGRLAIEIALETFNIFNHPDLGYIDPGATDLFFGQATLTLNTSFGSTGTLYQPGGPRLVQLAVRLHF